MDLERRRRRVCWFGESAAAGYLCAPHLTPARLLEAQLRETGGDWEVIDRSRINERLSSLADAVEAAARLKPDHLVVYAGNNHRLLETPELSPFAPPGRRALAAALRDEGALGAARLARRRGAERTAVTYERIADAAAALGAPLTLVLPEVSLADWETHQPPVRLPGDGTARWHRLCAEARTALAAGRAADAERAAWRMVDLDGGLGPTPFRLLAAAAGLDGRDADARDDAVSEVDAVHYPLLASLAAPQAGTPERRVLAAVAERRGLAVVDLRRVFVDWTGSLLPGRRLFLDYCHLSAEGMGVATAAVAAELLRQAGTDLPEDAWRRLAAKPAGSLVDRWTPAAEATARFGAAIHTAHRHLPVTDRGELLDAWCADSLDADPEAAAAAMLDLADARTATGPGLLTAAQQRNLDRPAPLGLQHGWRWPHLDADLLAAMRRRLAAAGRESDAAEIGRMIVGRRALPAAGTELAGDGFHLARPVARLLPEAMAHPGLAPCAALRCAWPETAFDLVTAGPGDVELELVARTPEREGGRVGVALGGAGGALAVGRGWRRGRLRLTVPAAGVHRLTLSWPDPAAAGEQPMVEAARQLAQGREATLQVVWGEVYSFVARPL